MLANYMHGIFYSLKMKYHEIKEWRQSKQTILTMWSKGSYSISTSPPAIIKQNLYLKLWSHAFSKVHKQGR